MPLAPVRLVVTTQVLLRLLFLMVRRSFVWSNHFIHSTVLHYFYRKKRLLLEREGLLTRKMFRDFVLYPWTFDCECMLNHFCVFFGLMIRFYM